MSIKYKVLLSVLCLFPLVGCQREEIFIEENTPDLPDSKLVSFVLKHPDETKSVNSDPIVEFNTFMSEERADAGSMKIETVSKSMDHPSTKAVTETTELSSFNVRAFHFISGPSGYGVDWTQVFSGGPIYTGGKEWPEEDGNYQFIAFPENIPIYSQNSSQIVLNLGAAVDDPVDYVYAKTTDAQYRTRNELEFKHMFARVGSVTVVASSGQTLYNIRIQMVRRTGGRFNIGYAANGAEVWSYPLAKDYQYIANSTPGTKENDFLTCSGSYELTASYTSVVGGVTKNYSDVKTNVTFEAGKITDLIITLGDDGIVPWEPEELTIVPVEGSYPFFLCFGYKSDGYDGGFYYKIDDGVWRSAYGYGSSNQFFHVDGDIKSVDGVNVLTCSYGKEIHIRSINSASWYTSYRYFMFTNSYNSLEATHNPVTKAYIYGNLGDLNTTDFTDLFNAELPFSVGAVLYNHPTKPLYAPFCEATSGSYDFTRTFKGTKLSYEPWIGSEGNGSTSRSVALANKRNITIVGDETFKGCTNLVGSYFQYTDNTFGTRNGVYWPTFVTSSVSMYEGCTSLGIAHFDYKYGYSTSGYDEWYNLNSVYNGSRMFYGCSNLNAVYCYGPGISTSSWMTGVAASGTFTTRRLSETNVVEWDTGVDGVPAGWSLLERYIDE